MAEAAGWRRFTRVTKSVPSGHKLYRASAPNYKTQDSDQDLAQEAVDFLVSQGIDSIISFNEYEYTVVEKERLAKAVPPIRYLHLKLGDFKPPTLAQFKQANDFFLQNTLTLVHCGYGWGRTGTGVTGLQIYTENVYTACERRVTGAPAGDSESTSNTFAIINFATGYYLTLSTDQSSVISLSPETVEATSTIGQAYRWMVSKDNQSNYTLSNKTTPTSFAFTKSQGAKIDDPVTHCMQTQGNTLFTIKEVASGDKGRYVISPTTSSTLAVAINTPDNGVRLAQSAQMPVLLASNDSSNKFGLWTLLTADFRVGLQGKAELEPEGRD